MPEKFSNLFKEPFIYLFSFFLIGCIAWNGFIGFRLRAISKLQISQAQLISNASTLQINIDRQYTSLEARIAAVERVTYAILPNRIEELHREKPNRPGTSWQKNRDEYYSKRIKELELFRMTLEKLFPEIKNNEHK